MRISILIVLCILLIIGSPLLLLSQEGDTDSQFKTLYREGIDLLKRGQYQDAYVSFEKALRLNPSSDLIRFMIQETGDLILKEMLTNPDLRQTALRILELGKGAYQRFIRTPEEIQKIVAQLDGPFDKKWEAINLLTAIGQRAAPFLVEQLGHQSEMTRINSMHSLEKIGNEAVLPLIESLQSKTMLVRQNSAIVLGVIRDERAVPELKRVWEDEKESIEVKQYVAEALRKITKSDADRLKPSKEYYYYLAEKYYYSHPTVMINFYGEYLIWRWNKESDRLEMKEVPDFTFNELLAEECCYDGLKLDDNYEPLWSLLVCILLARYNEADVALQAAQNKNKTGEIPEEILTKLRTDLSKLKDNLVTGSLGGKFYFYRALKRSLTDNNAPVAVSCIKILRETADFTDLPPIQRAITASFIGTPLIEALSHSDKRVRYAAAEALIKINPPQSFPDMEKVIPITNDALGESGVRVVLIIEPNTEVRSSLKTELTKLNCFLIETLSGEEGIKSAKRFPTEDLIILNNKVANEVVFTVDILGKSYPETVFDSLKDDVRTKGIPLIMIGTKEEIERAKSIYQEKVDAYAIVPVEKDVFPDTVNKVFQREDIQNDSKSRALQVCADAAKVLANLDIRNTIYSYRQSVEALAGTLENRPDDIRLSSLQAINRFADPVAIPALSKTIINKENQLLIRVKSAEALSGIFRNKPESITEEVYEILKKSIVEDEPEVKEAVAMALGNAKLTSAQRKELFELKRPGLPGE